MSSTEMDCPAAASLRLTRQTGHMVTTRLLTAVSCARRLFAIACALPGNSDSIGPPQQKVALPAASGSLASIDTPRNTRMTLS